jgi:hypothetical protein
VNFDHENMEIMETQLALFAQIRRRKNTTPDAEP